MELSPQIIIIICIFSVTFILNLGFGYLRSKTQKYSFKWFLYIHLSIPMVVLARILSHLDYRYIPVFVLAAVGGQIFGGRLGP